MDLISLLGFVLLLCVVGLVVQLFLQYIRFMFFAMIAVLLMVYFFGVSYADIMYWIGKAILWVL